MLIQLRRWQREAFALYESGLANGVRTTLWEATPGAGKTSAALEVVAHQLSTKRAKSALVVVPTSHLRIQWARAAARKGIQLDAAFSGDRSTFGADFQGAVVTYQQFGNNTAAFRSLALQSVVILDEVHHTGDGLTWGNAVQRALAGARFILCLSGTAFRSDNNPIPFVRYDSEESSVPDYTYSYADAVQDRVCRPVAVFGYGGSVSWSENEQVYSASFEDRLDPTNSARRLRAALDVDAGWIEPMLKDAHEMLLSTRKEHPAAGGLVVCADQDHARAVAELLHRMTRFRPTVVLSDDAEASRKIKTFSDDSSPWIVACNMVSEGVDIPRLRIGVYATTIRTKMYFRQFVGRIVRRQAGVTGLQIAYLYLPADPTLQQLASEIEQESRHSLRRADGWENEDDPRDRKREADPEKPKWMALSSINSGVESVIVQGNQLALFGSAFQPEEVRRVIDQEVEAQLEERLTRSESKAQLCSEIKTLVGILHHRSKRPHSAIHALLNKRQSVRSQTYCTEVQLKERRQLLEELLNAESRGPVRANSR